ncbi:9628_t:CDS:2 [Gigaspora margarita]|uniref:9628_t:CDS:1 n=1 Tax=Gigaspora margarita TaxID=4874 RepID=A0ABN7WMA3_GIGMA|nr:9628_t:CDS:2 [Gigaspora margarita]
MKLDDIKNLYTKVQEEVERVHDEQKILTLKMDRYIVKYIGISDPNFIAIIRHSIDLYKWIQQKNSRKELLMVEEKILIEEKLEDGKISSVEDGIKGDHFLLNKKRIIDNVDDSSTKKKMDNKIRVAEMTLNKSKLEVLSGENLEEVENKAVLLYAEYGCLDYGVEDTKKMISLFNKKEKFFKNKTDKSKEPVLEETLVSKANLNIKDKDKMVVDIQIKRTHQLHQNDAEVQKKTLTIRVVQSMKTTGHTKKNLWDTSFERVQEKKKKVMESISSRQTSTSRSCSSTRKALMSLNSAQNTLNQNKVLDKILRRLQNIEKRLGTYVPYRS